MVTYMPALDSILWSLKSIEYFETVEDLKTFIAEQRTRLHSFLGRSEAFRPDDVLLHRSHELDYLQIWTHHHKVTVGGVTVGYCGE